MTGQFHAKLILRFMADLDPQVSREECEIGFAEIDADRDGAIDFEEFAAWWN